MNKVEPLTRASNFEAIAHDLSPLLQLESNADIREKFPVTAGRYADHNLNNVISNLEEAASESMPGVRRQFIVFSGSKAVGMSVIRLVDDYPNCVDPDWPNLSGFVCNPYRNRGLGKLSLKTRLDYVASEFGGTAWSRVKTENAPSHAIMQAGGLTVIGKDPDFIVYKYSSKSG